MLLSRYRPERNWAWQHLGHVTRGWLWCHDDDSYWFDQGQPPVCTSAHSFLAVGNIPAIGWAMEARRIERPGSSPWAPCEFLCRKLIWRAGFSRSSQRKSVWLDVWIPKSWSKFSWSLCVDICSCLASRNELQPKLRQSEFPQKLGAELFRPVIYQRVANLSTTLL